MANTKLDNKERECDWVVAFSHSNKGTSLSKFHGTKTEAKAFVLGNILKLFKDNPYVVDDCPSTIEEIYENSEGGLSSCLQWEDAYLDIVAQPIETLTEFDLALPELETRPFEESDVEVYERDSENLDKLSGLSLTHVEDWYDDCNDYHFGCFHYGELVGCCTIGGADAYDVAGNDEVIHHPLYTEDSFLLSDVYIKPDFRNRGAGSTMIKQAIAWKRKNEGNKAVFIDVMESDLFSFYEKLGFVTVSGDEYTCSMVLAPEQE